MQTLSGFSGAHDAVVFNGEAASSANFTNAGSFNSLGSMDAVVNKDLDGTHRYVFAVYNGNDDINHNGIADDRGAGVLAYDHDGNGTTAVLMLPGVTSLTPSDLA